MAKKSTTKEDFRGIARYTEWGFILAFLIVAVSSCPLFKH